MYKCMYNCIKIMRLLILITVLFIMKIRVFGLIICIESKAAKNRNQVQLATRVL